MGGTLGNPIDEPTQQRINEKIQDVVKRFSIEFSKAYTQAVIAKAKLEIEPPTSIEDDLKLQTAPIPGHTLKSGILTKRGESVKSWKQRFFVAYNAKDNYKIDYHEGTNEQSKLKGTIFCAGYRAYEFNQDDITDHGGPGIKLVPWSYRRRTWWIKCDDEKERKDWLNVFETACYKSQAPRDEDECLADAFDITLRNLRWHYWFWGWYAQAGPEPERLGEFILDLLDRDIINAIIGGIVEGPAKAMTVDLIRKTIGTSVKAACSSAWISSSTAVRSLSATIQSSVKDLISPLLEKQKGFKQNIVDKIGGTINPFLADKGGALLKPVLNCMFKPVTSAFINGIKGWHAHMTSKISSNEFAPARFQSTLDYSDWQMDWWSGPLHSAYHVIWRMYTDDFSTVASLLVGGITPYTVYNMVMEKLKIVMHRAMFTFGSLAKSISESELASVLSHVAGLLFHDCLIMVRSVIADVLKAILDAPLQEMVLKPCKELIAPLQEMVDALPVPGLSLLFDLPTLLEDVVYSIENDSITAIVSGSVADIKSQFEVASAEIGIASINL